MGVCHIGLAEGGHNRPGEILFGTDSHTCTSGAFGTFATGIGDADAALICGIGKLWLKVPETMKFVVEGELPPYVLAKDLILRFIGDIGVGGATYRAMEFAGDAIWNLSVEEKMTICNMAIEAGGKNGIIEPTQEVIDFVKKRSPIPFEIMKSDHDAKYSFTKHYRAKDLVPAVAKPHSPDNYAPAEDLKDVKITRSYIGSCTGGKTEDFVAAAKILYNQKVKVPTFIVPATVKVESDLRTLTYEGKTLKQIFQDAGCEEPLAPGCQACLGGPKDTAGRANTAEVVVSTTNRNFIGRMGSKEAQIFLASPFTAAASAVNGFITDPRRFL
jgi:3-isopropylmalate/(R)-2-methylmalate dehydratase large subunit